MKVADKANEPRWSKSGNELYYLTLSDRPTVSDLMAVPFQPGAGGPVQFGAAQKLLEFQGRRFVPQNNLFQYGPHPDSKRFLVNVRTEESKPEIDVITNWQRLASGGGR